jgi:ATP-binding cassette subfamily B protein
VRRADLVAVLDNGTVVQQGTHDELMEHDGPYREFCRMQWQLNLDDEEIR